MLNSKIDEIYPEHAKALKIANLITDKFPKMKKILEQITFSNEKEKKTNENLKRRKVSRQTYFCIGICDVWKRKHAIHITLKKLREKYNLRWLRFSMSYHKFSNL